MWWIGTDEKLPDAEMESESTGAIAASVAILVAGVRRSGTSAITRTLDMVGCDLPATAPRCGVGSMRQGCVD